jgi:acetylornithine deacetylase/succinyl-diaminopimelate desuccinylase-like protein
VRGIPHPSLHPLSLKRKDFAHLDVVEAIRETWTVDPFVLTEKDGFFYGRGTIDIKNEVAILSANLIRLKQEGFKPDRDIILAFNTDEEAGGDANGVERYTPRIP